MLELDFPDNAAPTQTLDGRDVDAKYILARRRFFTVYGPWGRRDMMMWIFTSKILAGDPIPVFNNGQMMRDFTYIDDIVAGVVAAFDHPPHDDAAPNGYGGTKDAAKPVMR